VNHVINGAESTLGFTVLWSSVGAGHPQNHPMSGEEYSRGGVVELPVIVAMGNFDGAAKLCGDKGKKINKVEKVSDLTRKGKVQTKWEQSSRMTR
jgi:hypothetical protein